MKSVEQLYTYCVQTNLHTKNWCQMINQFAEEQMNKWSMETINYNNYYPVLVKLTWRLGIELMGILTNKCREQVNYRDVSKVADMICQDIGKKLTQTMRLRGDMNSVALFRVNHLDEGVMYFGPSDDAKHTLFLDGGMIMTEGYDAYMRSIGTSW